MHRRKSAFSGLASSRWREREGGATSWAVAVRLLFKKILKRLPGIARLSTHRRRGFFFCRHPNCVKRAVVLYILPGDALRYRLHALEPARRIEVHTLFAGVQFKPALGAVLRKLAQPWQNRAALRTTRERALGRHLQRSRPKRIFSRWLLSGPLLRLIPAVLVSVLTVFSVGHVACLPGTLSRYSAPSTRAARKPCLRGLRHRLHVYPACSQLFFRGTSATIRG